MCDTPGTRVESAVQKLTAELIKEYDWASRTPFPIPPDDRNDEAANALRRQTQSEQIEIQSLIRSQLPQFPAFFYEGCFQQPTYHWGLLHDLAKVFEFGEIPPVSWASLHLKDSDLQDTKLVELVWLSDFLKVPGDTIMMIIIKYRDSLNIGTKSQVNHNRMEHNFNPRPSHISHSHQQETPDGIEYHFMTEKTNQGHDGLQKPTQNTTMDSRTLSSVIQTVSNNKFNGGLDQSIDMLFTMFNLACQKFRVPDMEKLDLLTYAFSGPALNHFLAHKSRCNNFFEAEAMMRQAYNSAARQLQVVRLLEQLRYRKFASEKDVTDAAEGLKQLVEFIERLMPLTPTAYHHSSHKISFLKKAVIDQEWAKEPVKNINALHYDFENFVTALHDSIQAEQELKSAKLEGDAEALVNYVRRNQAANATHLTSFAQPNEEDMFNTLLGHFGRNPKDLKCNSFSRNYPGVHIAPNPCRRCGAQWRPGHRCENGKIKSHVRNRIRNGDNHVHIISDLVNSMEEQTDQQSNNELQDDTSSTHLAEFDKLIGNEPTGTEIETQFITNQISDVLACDNLDNPEQDFQ